MTQPNFQFTIRRAAEADCEQLRALAAEAFPAAYRTILSPKQIGYMLRLMYDTEVIRREMQNGFAWFIACCDEEPCGYLSIERAEADLFILQKIYLRPGFQGCGAGRFLFRQALAHIRGVHPDPCRLELHVNRHNRAQGFYERMGMHRLREGDFPIGNGYYMNDYIMGMEIREAPDRRDE